MTIGVEPNEMSNSQQLAAFNQQLTDCRMKLREKQKLSAMQAEAKRQLATANDSKRLNEARLQKEDTDVAVLEGISITGLFYSVLGTKEDRLKKERQEALAAKLKYDQSVDQVEDLTEEVERLQQQFSSLGDVEAEYEKIIAEKAVFLSERDDVFASQLTQISEQLADLVSQETELLEAVDAGESARQSLDEILQTVSSAANWGAVDMMGGGMFATMIKHSKMDAAKKQAGTTQRRLLKFKEELADADTRLQVSLQIDGFTTFADYFFDGLIMDWVVQSKIANAKKECTSTLDLVNSAIKECRRRLQTVRNDVRDVESQKQQLIEST